MRKKHTAFMALGVSMTMLFSGCSKQAEPQTDSTATNPTVMETEASMETVAPSTAPKSEAVNQFGELFDLNQIDTNEEETEKETAKEIVTAVLSKQWHMESLEDYAKVIAEKTDISVTIYGQTGELMEGETLLSKTENLYQMVYQNYENLSATAKEMLLEKEVHIGDVTVAGKEDMFWDWMRMDSEAEIISMFPFDITEQFQIDKAYCVTMEDSENLYYVVRINGEWKFENLFNSYYNFFVDSSQQFNERETTAERKD